MSSLLFSLAVVCVALFAFVMLVLPVHDRNVVIVVSYDVHIVDSDDVFMCIAGVFVVIFVDRYIAIINICVVVCVEYTDGIAYGGIVGVGKYLDVIGVVVDGVVICGVIVVSVVVVVVVAVVVVGGVVVSGVVVVVVVGVVIYIVSIGGVVGYVVSIVTCVRVDDAVGLAVIDFV